MHNISQNIAKLGQRICLQAEKNGRDPKSITLLAVSKTRDASELRQAYQAGQHCFGENYLQEAEQKIAELSDLGIDWHFIGPIQSNKTRAIAQQFNWVHSVDLLELRNRHNEQRPATMPPLNICLQVNINHEVNKAGIKPNELVKLAQNVATLPQLKLRGLMAIPEATSDTLLQHKNFAAVQALFEQLQQHIDGLDTLSMGMSADLEIAIQAGATMLRVGEALFGPRTA